MKILLKTPLTIQVEYFAQVEGRSPLGNLIDYMHEERSIHTGNVIEVRLQPLIQHTNYLLKVAALTDRGKGMQVRTTGITNNATSEFSELIYRYYHHNNLICMVKLEWLML